MRTRTALLALPLLLACRSTPPPNPEAAPSPLVYVSNEDSNDVSVIDTATDSVVKTLFVGKRPRGLRVSRDGSTLYVAVSGSPRSPPGVDESTLPPPDRAADGIAAVDLRTGKLVRTHESGSDPEAFDVSLDGRWLYASNEDAATLTVLDLRSGEIRATVPVGGEPEGVTLHPDGRSVYVTAEADDLVYVVDTATNQVTATLKTDVRPRAVAFTSDGRRGLVSVELGGTVALLDAERPSVLSELRIDAPGARPMGVVVAPGDRLAYATCGRGGQVAEIDLQSGKVARVFEKIGTRPWGIAITPDGKKLYTANGPDNDVSVIDVASGRVVKRIPAGGLPWGVALGPPVSGT